MLETDEWGRDPTVRMMRRVFKNMESGQAALLKRLGISPVDARLRHWREKALKSFEKCRPQAAGWGGSLSEEMAARLYLRCLVRTMASERIEIPADALPPDEKMDAFLDEILP